MEHLFIDVETRYFVTYVSYFMDIRVELPNESILEAGRREVWQREDEKSCQITNSLL